MSRIITTEFGRLNVVRYGDGVRTLLEVPGCGKWEPLNEEQLAGRLSVNHAAICSCGYHETHPFGNAGHAALAARVLTPSSLDPESHPWDDADAV